jgi:predicted HTH transcriptional regulator
VIARIVVARGEAPLHIIDGVVYVRYGSSEVQAQPEDLKKLVTQYAF